MTSCSAQRCFSRIAAWSERFAILVVLGALLGAGLAFNYTAHHLGINTDTGDMFSRELAWRKTYHRYTDAFPMYSDNLIVVVDAESAEAAEASTDALEQRLRAEKTTLDWIYRPGGGEFFARNALLYMEMDELEDLVDNLAAIQPFIGSLAGEPSAAELFEITAKALSQKDDIDERQLARMLSQLSQSIEASVAGRPRQLSWQEIMLDRESSTNDKRRILLVKPKLNYDKLLPAGPAMDRIREIAVELGIDQTHGRSVRITGSLAMSVEELDSVSRGATSAALSALLVVSIVLVVGLRSLKLVLVSVVTLLVGLSFTAAFAAYAIGHLNLISVAFAVLYIGLGIDFAIHLGLRHRELTGKGEPHAAALAKAVSDVGSTLFVCALTTGIGFYAFTVTDFTGVSELGLISGTGMFISLALSVTLMPALLTLAPLKTRPVETSKRKPTNEPRNPSTGKPVLWVAVALGLVALVLIPQASFDRNPLNVREADSESVSTFRDLMRHTQTSPWPIVTVAPRDQVAPLKQRLEALTQVDSTLSIDDFVPADQDDKLFLVDELSLLMGATLEVQTPSANPDEEKTKNALDHLLTAIGGQINLKDNAVLGSSLSTLERSAGALQSHLRENRPGLLVTLDHNLVGTLPQALSRLSDALDTEGVDFDDLPAELRRRWIARDGRHRIEVVPAEYIQEPGAMRRFVDAVRVVAPDATDSPVTLLESGDAVVQAFQQAMLTALILIALLLFALLRDLRDVALVLGPLLLAGCYTVACMVVLDIPFNFANVITLPLLLGIGVDNGIHMVRRWRTEPSPMTDILRTSTARAVVVSALTTICSFGNLAFSPHPGTASMGQVLSIGLAFNLICTLVILPNLLRWRAKPA